MTSGQCRGKPWNISQYSATTASALFLIILIVGNFAADSAVHAEVNDNSIQGNTKKLKVLQDKIKALQQELTEDNNQKNIAVSELQKVETSINRIANQLYTIDKQLRGAHADLDSLKLRRSQLTKNFAEQRKYLLKQVRASYIMGNQEYFKLLLNQQDPSRVARMIVYYQYLNQSRTDKMLAIQGDLEESQIIESRIEQKTSDLETLREKIEKQKTELQLHRQDRSQWMAALSSQMQKKDQALQILLRDELHLKRLLKQIEDELKDVQLDLKPPKPFGRLKGQLPWPATGQIDARFGSKRKAGNLTWNGILINTQSGQQIKSIAYGQVVFADWLRGFGMLIIIDHGDGYMSLYGHNESLMKNPGDWVQAEDVIALSGTTGGQNTSSVYFEIRHNGKPQNPKRWCRRFE